MRPTIDEQLTGASRLLRLAEADPEIAPGVAGLVRNARRLVEQAGTAWSAALPFLRKDNARVAALLGVDEPGTTGLAETARRNEELREELSRRIRALPPGPERAAIGSYLRSRVDADPT
ncbi:hypothetical protein LWP59_17515 [Amycolatopsis acidiphila]|uniref:Uncharacterized protein n=1 Tax=Amycolatopsis acidiphila TaxID=715473 RepID=A0A558ANZ5_9PSEU|nr:hypothetical protein [Amycolatopsis acidiphila]TVT25981.1 hypothetical protein FNH06_00700 [Amycolatopsis acidiphila]UIJ63304.1 hypothetical protein LWP59_17515 [Amycolatopsis acidiphila]GHG74913.1 hypothetical protein GCM10017788_39260 [Amycolatopsis acidiphila]